MFDFRTQYDRSRQRTNNGDPIKITYTPRYDEHGVIEVYPTGKDNLYEYIQSHAESVDINFIMRQFEQGDVSVISRVQGIYADVSEAPKSYMEMLNMINEGERNFNALPAEVKQKFHNSFSEFLAASEGDLQQILQKIDGCGDDRDGSSQAAADNPASNPASEVK